MHLGVDFDNTLVGYDELFHRCAVERGWVPADVPVSKAAVRAYLWSLPDGNTPWTELQGEVYGTRMSEAQAYPHALDTLRFCRRHGIRVSIISHKNEYPALGPRVNLREAALRWMEEHGFFDPQDIGLSQKAVFFTDTREEKLALIGSQGCTHFVDDLPEVLLAAEFPPRVERWLFDPCGSFTGESAAGIRVFRSWVEIQKHLELMI